MAGFFGLAFIAKGFGLGAYRGEPMISLNPEIANVVIFKKGTTYEQRNYFEENVMATPRPDGRGHAHLPGVQITGVGPSYPGHETYMFTFFGNATDEQKQFVYDRVRAAPIVEELRINVPMEEYRLPPTPNTGSDNRPKKDAIKNEVKFKSLTSVARVALGDRNIFEFILPELPSLTLISLQSDTGSLSKPFSKISMRC